MSDFARFRKIVNEYKLQNKKGRTLNRVILLDS